MQRPERCVKTITSFFPRRTVADFLAEALAGRIARGDAIPDPSRLKRGQYPVSVPLYRHPSWRFTWQCERADFETRIWQDDSALARQLCGGCWIQSTIPSPRGFRLRWRRSARESWSASMTPRSSHRSASISSLRRQLKGTPGATTKDMRGRTHSQALLFKGIHGPALRFKSCFVAPFATPNVALRLRCNESPCMPVGWLRAGRSVVWVPIR